MKVLIIDDSTVARKQVALAVESLGYEPLEAADGEAGLAALSVHRDAVALILLDWNMPGLSGLDVLRRIKADAHLADIPVMMVTTEMERSNMIEAVKAGAKQYLTKPFSPEDLEVRILQCLGVGQ